MFNTFCEFDEDNLIKIHQGLSLFDEVLDNYVVRFEDNIGDLKSVFLNLLLIVLVLFLEMIWLI